jgi:arylsulfatase A-like enzyme
LLRLTVPIGFTLSAGLYAGFAGRVVFYGLVGAAASSVLTAAYAAAAFRPGRAGFAAVRAAVWATFAAVTVAANAAFFITYPIYKAYELRGGARLAVFGGAFAAGAVAFGGVYGVFRRAARRSPALRRGVRRVVMGVLIVAGATGAAVVVQGKLAAALRPRPAGRPDVVLITLDAWRADACNAALTPRICDFARSYGVHYDHARAAGTWTLPSFAASFTGRYDVTDRWGLERRGDVTVTWPQALWENGYDTYALTKNPYLDRYRLIHRGFGTYFNPDTSRFLRAVGFYDTVWQLVVAADRWRPERPGEISAALTDAVLATLRRDTGRPKFVWVHYLDPHYPYNAPPAALAEVEPALTPDELDAIRSRGLVLSNAAGLERLYRAEVRGTDAAVAPVLAVLARRPRTVVIIMSDHGEDFGEHGDVAHGRNVYDAAARVPLIVAATPDLALDGRGTTRTADVSSIDVGPSLLTYLGLKVPREMEGRRDLFALGGPAGGRDVYVVRRARDGVAVGLVRGDKKVVAKTARGGVVYEYFDVAADPAETTPLPWDEGGVAMRNALRARFGPALTWSAGRGDASPFEGKKELRDLGYVD